MPMVDLKNSPGKANMGGTLTKAYLFEIADLVWPQTTPLVLSGVGKLDVSVDLEFDTGKKLWEVYCTPAKGKLDGNTVGEIDGLSNENVVEIFFPGNDQECAEVKAYLLNRPVGLIVPDTRGNLRLVGIASLDPATVALSIDLPAYLTGAPTVSGAARADLAGTTFTFTASARHDALYYKGALQLTPAL